MEWEQKLKDKYGLSDYQSDRIKEIFKVTILDISEATKNNETLNETIWEAGVVELIKNSEQIGENLLMNSIFQLSACLLARTIRQSLEQNLNNSSQSSSELSNKFYESTTFSTSDQLIDKKLTNLVKLELAIKNKENELKSIKKKLKSLKREKWIRQLELCFSEETGNSIPWTFLIKVGLVSLGIGTVFSLLVNLATTSWQPLSPEFAPVKPEKEEIIKSSPHY